ncbi:unnamed protein product [Oreochromis niloticus]|nr:unnamed protein product [Mustela putorius furo]
MPSCGILIVKDPPGAMPSVPGILGMNVIRRCYQELFGAFGGSLFNSPSVSQAPRPVLETLHQCHQSAAQAPEDPVGTVKVQGPRAVRIPGGVMQLVATTCSQQLSGQSVLFEPPESGLPFGLLASPCLVQVDKGVAYIPVTNVGTAEAVLHPRTHLGVISQAAVVSLPAGVSEEHSFPVTVSSHTTSSPAQDMVDAIDLSALAESEQHEYETSSSLAEGVLPGTPLPTSLQQAQCPAVLPSVTQLEIGAFPSHSLGDIRALQEADPLLKDFLVYWRRQSPPSSEERSQVPEPVMVLLRQSGGEGWHPLSLYFASGWSPYPGPAGLYCGPGPVNRVVFFKFGVPSRLHSDQGRNFESLVMQQVCELYRVAKSRTTPYHPAGNGQCDWFNRTLHNLLWTLPSSRKRDWAACLPHVLFCYNSTPHQGTGESPFFLMFGRDPRLPIDFLLGRVQDPVPGEVQDWVAEHQARLMVAFEGARARLSLAADRRKERHDQRVHLVPLKVGQLVYLRDHSARGRHKIQDLWSSVVYQVLRAPQENGAVYTIAPMGDLEKVRHVHRDMLKAQVNLGPPTSGPQVPPPPAPADLSE